MNTNTEHKTYSAKYGYIVLRSREPGDTCPLGVIDASGDYKPAFPNNEEWVNMAVYPTREAAEAAMKRACGESDPLIYDGLNVMSLRHTQNITAHLCAVHGFVEYPDGKPACTDYESPSYA